MFPYFPARSVRFRHVPASSPTWLKKAKDLDIWVAHWLVSAPPSDGGKAKIPKLKYKVGEEEVVASTNEEKSTALARCFFPAKPQGQDTGEEVKYPKVCKGVGKITRDQIREQLRKTKPFKAPGLDGIPNVVLSNCTDLIIDRLYFIFNAMLERGIFYSLWKVSTVERSAFARARACLRVRVPCSAHVLSLVLVS